MSEISHDLRTLYCGNISENVTEDILFELFLQVSVISVICNLEILFFTPQHSGYIL